MKLNKFIDIASWTAQVISLILMKVSSKYVENIIFGKKFVFIYAMYGLIIAAIWLFMLYKMNKNYFLGEEKRASAILCQFFSIMIFTIFLSAFYTFKTGQKSIYLKKAILAEKGNNLRSNTFYIYPIIEGRKERFVVSQTEHKNFEIGDTLILTIGRGKTNYESIYKFQKK